VTINLGIVASYLETVRGLLCRAGEGEAVRFDVAARVSEDQFVPVDLVV
jgi:hypothetical protein